MPQTRRQELITPKKAEALLRKNTRNRSMRAKHVAKLTRAIERGEWQPNNPTPVVVNGKALLDGQHRLAAVVDSGIAVKMWVWRGAPEEVMATIDTGLTRNLADALRIREEPYPPVLAGALRQVYLYKTEGLLGGKSEKVTPSHAELLALLDQHPELREITKDLVISCSNAKLRGLGSPSLIAAAHWIFLQIDREDAEVFLHRLMSGAELEEGSPILALHRVMSQSRRKPKPRVLGALLVKAWNHWQSGEEREVLSWRAGGSQAEKFPEILGAEKVKI